MGIPNYFFISYTYSWIICKIGRHYIVLWVTLYYALYINRKLNVLRLFQFNTYGSAIVLLVKFLAYYTAQIGVVSRRGYQNIILPSQEGTTEWYPCLIEPSRFAPIPGEKIYKTHIPRACTEMCRLTTKETNSIMQNFVQNSKLYNLISSSFESHIFTYFLRIHAIITNDVFSVSFRYVRDVTDCLEILISLT